MKPQNPSTANTDSHHLVLGSLYKTLRANISMGSAATYASDGSIATYSQDNLDGILVRVAPTVNPLGLPNSWNGSNVDTLIEHNLARVPIGYIVVKKNKTCDVYDGSVASTTQAITLKNTDGTADTVVYIF